MFDLRNYAKIWMAGAGDKDEFVIKCEDNSRYFRCENVTDKVYVYRIRAEHVTCPFMEQYDSDAVLQDAAIDCNHGNSNISHLSNAFMFDLIQQYVQDQQCM